MKCTALVLAACAAFAAAAPAEDAVPTLPGFGAPAQDTYSGYLTVQGTAKRLHYLFVRAQTNAANAPVVLWMNGGPGCSSLDGYFYEHGPQHVNNDANLEVNPYSWNKYANMLYMEAPAGVGYSYSTNPADYNTNDLITADDNYHALQNFFTEKFPELSSNAFLVSGESYGGIYVPTLTVRILQGNNAGAGQNINLKGFLVGNGVNEFNTNSLIEYVYYHGFIGSALWKTLQATCEGKYDNPPNAQCAAAVNQASNVVYNGGLNFYGWNLECHDNSPGMNEKMRRSAELLFPGVQLPAKTEALAREHMLAPSVTAITAATGNLQMNVPCINSTAGTIYLNRADVRAALHIPAGLPDWGICTDQLNYTKTVHDITPYWSKAIESGVHFTNYAGDTDMACNFLGNEQALASLNLTLSKPTAPWHVDQQVAGFFTAYTEGADLWTVKGSGHMVPQFRPQEAEVMFRTALERSGAMQPNPSSDDQVDDQGQNQDDLEGTPAALRGNRKLMDDGDDHY